MKNQLFTKRERRNIYGKAKKMMLEDVSRSDRVSTGICCYIETAIVHLDYYKESEVREWNCTNEFIKTNYPEMWKVRPKVPHHSIGWDMKEIQYWWVIPWTEEGTKLRMDAINKMIKLSL